MRQDNRFERMVREHHEPVRFDQLNSQFGYHCGKEVDHQSIPFSRSKAGGYQPRRTPRYFKEHCGVVHFST
jgi:hypothetical protein